jgi:uroporphyrinogen-III decarboxylase
MPSLTPEQRVLTAFQFKRPDRIPVFDQFWELPDNWKCRLGDLAALSDVTRFIPDETPFPSRKRILKEKNGWVFEVDAWGRTIRSRRGAHFVETLEAPLAAKPDLDQIEFDSPSSDARYYGHKTRQDFEESLKAQRAKHYVYVKTGGPYLRTTFMRGEAQFLIDMAADPTLAAELAQKVADHIAAIGVEALNRSGLHGNGVWIYDDMAYNDGPMFGPKTFERVLLPAYRRMIGAYRQAGAKYVFLHSDGDIRPLLDMLVDAGIDGLNPLEQRAGMKMTEIRAKYPRLVLTGGMCNTRTLLNGPIPLIEAQAREIIDLGRDGGIVIGTHSIGPDVPLEHYLAYRKVCEGHGQFGD